MKPIIEVNKLSKRYEYGIKEPYYSLRDSVTNWLTHPVKTIFKSRAKQRGEFWALKDVSFKVNEGEIIGIIGRNGAGKTTLLKVLSRITPPTKGNAVLRGRVASLLEVGTGFHPELTGRENIFLNGAILGMSRREVKNKFDEIVEFAEIQRFLDTPVKRYSSGMHMRLAFAVAANLEAEILLIDEVLSVGDIAFQQKSLGRMENISKSGRTILFVSHNMGMVRKLCQKGMIVKNGHCSKMADIDSLISSYQQYKQDYSASINLDRYGLKFNDFRINGISMNDEPEIFPDGQVEISGDYRSTGKKSFDLCVSFALRKKEDYTLMYYSHNHLENVHHMTGKKGNISLRFHLPHISPGKYTVETQIWLDGHLVIDDFEMGDISVASAPAFASHQSFAKFPAHLLIPSQWRIRK